MNNILPVELPATWFIDGNIDYELKIYKLLSFIQKIESNYNNGFIYDDFLLVSKRLKDLESYSHTQSVVNQSDDRFKFIYDLPDSSNIRIELEKIITVSCKMLTDIHNELAYDYYRLKSDIKVIDKRKDLRKSTLYFIQNGNSELTEEYLVGKSKISYNRSFISASQDFLFTDDNYVHVITDNVYNTEFTLLPIAVDFIKRGFNY